MSVAYCALTHQAYWVAEPSGWWWNRVTCHVSAIDGNLVRFPGTAPDDRQAAAGADSEADPDHDAGIAVQHHEGRAVGQRHRKRFLYSYRRPSLYVSPSWQWSATSSQQRFSAIILLLAVRIVLDIAEHPSQPGQDVTSRRVTARLVALLPRLLNRPCHVKNFRTEVDVHTGTAGRARPRIGHPLAFARNAPLSHLQPAVGVVEPHIATVVRTDLEVGEILFCRCALDLVAHDASSTEQIHLRVFRQRQNPLPPLLREHQTVRFGLGAAMPTWVHLPAAAAPRHGVRRGQIHRVGTQPGGFDTEPVECETIAGEGSDDGTDLAGRLTAAHRPETHQRLHCQIDAGGGVHVGAAQVVLHPPALQHRDERQIRGDHS